MIPDVQTIDHVHVFVRDRAAAEAWYQRVLGFSRTPELAFWADDGGPLTIQNAGGSVHLALFARGPGESRSTIALRASAAAFVDWLAHLTAALPNGVTVEDHEVSVSLYFRDPDGNPYEITTYEHEAARALMTR